MGTLDIGISGLRVAQASLLVTEHNIANANTAGYTRQSTVQSTSIPLSSGSGYYGTGVQLDTIKRQYNSFLTSQVNKSQTKLSELDAYKNSIQVIDNLLADPSSGISPALQDFFKGVQQVASYPSQLEARQSLVSSAQSLVTRFQAAEQRFSDQYEQINQQISDNVDLLNNYATQVAKLNEQIIKAQSTNGQPPNDLLDQRDNLISEMNKVIQVSTATQSDGSLQVFIGNGQQVVSGTQANRLVAVYSSKDPSRMEVGLDVGGGVQELPENLIAGGQLGGFMAFRRETLDTALNALGNVATSLALTFNAQHSMGMDLLGNSGSALVDRFFTLADPKVIPPQRAGAPTVAVSYSPASMSSPVGSGNYYTNLTGSDYTLSYDGTQFSLTRQSDGKIWQSASIAGLNAQTGNPPAATDPQGFVITPPGAGSFAVGDSYLIQPTREAARNIGIDQRIAGDVRRIAAALPVKGELGLSNAGTMSMSVSRMIGIPANNFGTTPINLTYDSTTTSLSGFPSGSVNITQANGTTSTVVIGGPATAVPLTVGATYEWDGVVFSFKGTPQNGDTYSLVSNAQPGSVGVSDASNMLLLGKMQTQKTMAGNGSGGTATLQGAYAQMVSSVGNKAAEVEVTYAAQKSIFDQATADRDSYSGVNLDEEAANLVRYQQAYQAAAKTIDIARSTFSELIAILNG